MQGWWLLLPTILVNPFDIWREPLNFNWYSFKDNSRFYLSPIHFVFLNDTSGFFIDLYIIYFQRRCEVEINFRFNNYLFVYAFLKRFMLNLNQNHDLSKMSQALQNMSVIKVILYNSNKPKLPSYFARNIRENLTVTKHSDVCHIKDHPEITIISNYQCKKPVWLNLKM